MMAFLNVSISKTKTLLARSCSSTLVKLMLCATTQEMHQKVNSCVHSEGFLVGRRHMKTEFQEHVLHIKLHFTHPVCVHDEIPFACASRVHTLEVLQALNLLKCTKIEEQMKKLCTKLDIQLFLCKVPTQNLKT